MLLSTGAAETMALVAARRAMMLNCMFAVLVGYPKGWIEVIEDCWWSGLEDWMDELMILSTIRADERRYIHVWAGLRSPSPFGHSFAEPSSKRLWAEMSHGAGRPDVECQAVGMQSATDTCDMRLVQGR
jgi:hypothetical protein